MIYFIECEAARSVKIGFAANDVAKRLALLQTGCPFELRLAGVIPGDVQTEKRIHLLLGAIFGAVRGEWFESTHALEFLRIATADGLDAAMYLCECRINANKNRITADVAKVEELVGCLGLTSLADLLSAMVAVPELREQISPQPRYHLFACEYGPTGAVLRQVA